MSQTNTASTSSLQSRMGTLVVIPWAGAHEDGEDIAFLLAYSLGDGVDGPAAGQEAVLEAAREIGLPVGGTVLDVAQVQKFDVRLLVAADKAVLTMPYLKVTCPVPDQWTAAARARGSVHVILASRPWPEGVPGARITEEELRAFAADEEVLSTAAHFRVPAGSLNR
ncbi:hypothetical protein SAMN05216223_105353 [Actinacidiphila yanglinensis]|uniref:Uncharacterized protein n=1 Tax=Actinacidiphila yanglinensis TaxID=310779 RepID=A0A1H6AE49_9ACTN|nr:DUF5949 family protein [Actinacidiphila yanglinensis]SEG47013.1 hypothetical protein SAMN05216223_105353 [Actinacidiphila yanglinensis]